MGWIAQNWHVVWALIGVIAMLAAFVHFRRNPEAPGHVYFFDWFRSQIQRALHHPVLLHVLLSCVYLGC